MFNSIPFESNSNIKDGIWDTWTKMTRALQSYIFSDYIMILTTNVAITKAE